MYTDGPGKGLVQQRARAALRDEAQTRGVSGIPQMIPGLYGTAVRAGEESARVRQLRLRELAAGEAGEPLRHDEAIVRKTYSAVEQDLPCQPPEALVRGAEHGQHTGHPGRTTAEHGVAIAERLAVLADEQLRRGALRRRLATIESGDLAGACVVVEQEGAAGNTGALRLHQPQGRLHGDRRVRGTATGAQYFQSGLHRHGIRSGHPGRRQCRARGLVSCNGLALLLRPAADYRQQQEAPEQNSRTAQHHAATGRQRCRHIPDSTHSGSWQFHGMRLPPVRGPRF